MSLTGTRIGVFEVRSLLGAGAMGEVYRARDTRLERDVALKIINPALAADAEHMRGIDREARILASISHPNIAAIFGVEDVSSGSGPMRRALVLELVEGDTLEARIERLADRGSTLPLNDVIDIAAQVAAALDAAHQQGIVHCDLKPGNISVSEHGRVKVLDFGIARAFQRPDGGDAVTITGGALGGTPAYMSPEQARGKGLDKRTDIWAFGCVLFEMLTGNAPFARATIADTISAVLNEAPDWSKVPAPTPTALQHLLRWCLERDPGRRLRDIGDARFTLSPSGAAETAKPQGEVQFRRVTDLPGMNEQPAISPDGRMVAFVATSGGFRHIWIQLLGGGAPLQVTRDAVHHEHPRWTPDSAAIIYYTPPASVDDEGTIWEMPALGGTARPIASALASGDVSHSGERIALVRRDGSTHQLVAVRRDGSDPRVIASLPRGARCTRPRWSPDDRLIAAQMSNLEQFAEDLTLFPVGGGSPRTIASGGSLPGCAWLPDGSGLVYSSSAGSTLPYPRTCNLRRVTLDGHDTQVTFGDVSHVTPDMHASGTLAVCRVHSRSDIWRVPVGGAPDANAASAIRITRQTGHVQVPSASPDGRDVVYLSDNGGHGNLWLTRTDGSDTRQLTFERDPLVSIGVPIWCPNGSRIAFVKSSGPSISIWLVNRDGRDQRQLVAEGFAAAWSVDGEWLYYNDGRHSLASMIKKIRADGGPAVTVRQAEAVHAVVPGDGVLYFATTADRGSGSSDWRICRAAPEDAEPEVVARVNGARVPVSPLFVQGALSPDGQSIALPLMDGVTTNLWAVPTAGGALRPLTDFGDRATLIVRQVSWAPDGHAIYAAIADVSSDVVTYVGLL